MKKIFVISATLFAFVLLFLGIYNFAFRPQTVQPRSAVTNSPVKGQKEESGPIREVTLQEARFLKIVRQDEKIRYFSQGKLFESEQDGSSARILSSEDFLGIKDAKWSLSGDKVVFRQETQGKDNFFVFDVINGKKHELKSGIDAAAFENSANLLSYKYFDFFSGRKSLNVANADGTGWRELAEVSERFLEIAPIPKSNLISFWNRGISSEKTFLRAVPAVGGPIKPLFEGRYGADYLWAPDGKKVLVSSTENPGSAKFELGVLSLDGSYKGLGIPTLVHKAVWSADGHTIYYALPGGIPEGSRLPEEYWQKKFPVRDSFWKADIETGKKERLIELEEIAADYDVLEMSLSTTENALLFTDRSSGKLYRISL